MPEYRSPAEWQAQQDHEARVRSVLDQAVADGASCLAAMELDEDTAVDLWTNRLWDGLRDNLSDLHPDAHPELSIRADEDRLFAIVLLLSDQMHERAAQVIESVREAGDA